MNIILLSGGSGKRLWPLSNEARSKQFLKLLNDGQGNKESMIQRIYRQIRETGIEAKVLVTTNASQIDSIQSQLGGAVELITEPERRDTFPAIALAVAYLRDEMHSDEEEFVAVMPVDPYTETAYFETIIRMEQVVRDGAADMALMGITPAYPAEKYGYILPGANHGTYADVERFVEKPDAAQAAELIQRGAMWNAGVFLFRIGYLLGRLKEMDLPVSYREIYEHYGEMKKTSFDYEIVEKTASIAVVPFSGKWKDLGTWNTLAEEIQEDFGLVVRGEGTENSQFINELGIPLIALGVRDMVVVASPDGILVSGKNESSYMKPYVERLTQRPMYEERRWGYYKVVDYNTFGDKRYSLTKHLFIGAGKKLSYQSHDHRDEIWTVVEGSGVLLLDGHTRNVRKGDVAYIDAGMKHALCAITDLHMIEVQIGEDLTETDIVRYSIDW